jgi:DNA-binding PadR family transcriptional regulator
MSKTSNTADKRGRADLELFLLALLRRGISTPYDLKASAAISPGASIPALARLEASGFVSVGEQTARGRVEYSVTLKGKKHLENSWKPLFQKAPPRDLESVLRTACLAFFMGEKPAMVADYLTSASKSLNSQPNLVEPMPALQDPALFGWMRQVIEPARKKAEASGLAKLASAVKKSGGKKRSL